MSQSWMDLETTLTHPWHHGAVPSETTKGPRVGGAGPSCWWLFFPGSPCCEGNVSLPPSPQTPHSGGVFPLVGLFEKPRAQRSRTAARYAGKLGSGPPPASNSLQGKQETKERPSSWLPQTSQFLVENSSQHSHELAQHLCKGSGPFCRRRPRLGGGDRLPPFPPALRSTSCHPPGLPQTLGCRPSSSPLPGRLSPSLEASRGRGAAAWAAGRKSRDLSRNLGLIPYQKPLRL